MPAQEFFPTFTIDHAAASAYLFVCLFVLHRTRCPGAEVGGQELQQARALSFGQTFGPVGMEHLTMESKLITLTLSPESLSLRKLSQPLP